MKTEKKTKIVILMRSISRMIGSSKIIKIYDTECAQILLPLKIQDELLALADELEVENENS